MWRWIGGLLGALLMTPGCDGTTTFDAPDGSAPLGAVNVRWQINSTEGGTLTCAEIGVNTVEIRVGGAPRSVDCVEGASLFEGLSVGRYAVIVTLKVGAAELASGRANAEVMTARTTELAVPITVQPRNLDAGSVVLRWQINGEPAAAQCGAVGASQVAISTEPGSADETLTAVASCTDASITLQDVKPGGYQFRLRLQEFDGTLITSNLSEQITVKAAETITSATIPLVTQVERPGQIVALYTVNGTVAVEGCRELDATEVLISVKRSDDPTGGSRITQSSSCTEGMVIADRLNTNFYDVRMELKDFFRVVVSSTVVKDVSVRRGETSTVTVDLSP